MFQKLFGQVFFHRFHAWWHQHRTPLVHRESQKKNFEKFKKMDRGNRIGCGGGNVSTNIKHIAQSTCIRHTFTLWSTFIAEVLALSNNCSYTLPSYDPKAEFNTVSLMSKASTNAIVSGRNCTCLVKPKKKKTKRRKEEGKKIIEKKMSQKKNKSKDNFFLSNQKSQ